MCYNVLCNYVFYRNFQGGNIMTNVNINYQALDAIKRKGWKIEEINSTFTLKDKSDNILCTMEKCANGEIKCLIGLDICFADRAEIMLLYVKNDIPFMPYEFRVCLDKMKEMNNKEPFIALELIADSSEGTKKTIAFLYDEI